MRASRALLLTVASGISFTTNIIATPFAVDLDVGGASMGNGIAWASAGGSQDSNGGKGSQEFKRE